MHALLLSIIAAFAVGHAAAQELKINVTHPVTCDRKTRNGDMIHVNYNGTLTNGTLFDSSYEGGRSDPITFALGAGRVIQGWDKGLLDMCVGERRTLTIPPNLAYGSRRVGEIPANSTLIFDTELTAIDGAPQPHHD